MMARVKFIIKLFYSDFSEVKLFGLKTCGNPEEITGCF